MGEKVPASTLTVDTDPSNWDGFAEDWSPNALKEARDQRIAQLGAQGQKDLAEYYKQGDQLEELAHRATVWENPGGMPASQPEAETTQESPKRKGLMKRFGSRVVSMLGRGRNPAESSPFDRDSNGW